MKKLTLLFGGTFDPVHNKHIAIAKALHEKINCDEILFIPCKVPVLKDPAQASEVDRLAMLKIALAPLPYCSISESELKRPSPSYAVDTLRELHKQKPNTIFAFIVGSDAFSELLQWHEWENLLQLTHLILINRPRLVQTFSQELTSLLEKRQVETPEDLLTKNAGLILPIQLPPSSLASRDIRREIATGAHLENSLPNGVWEYIQANELYTKQQS